ncbi:MAG TPA: NUDIX hydrolase [Solirubrobacteraceae bacterium]|nr:NUDIX hydrolase [Solirubrobacteraceae bacterium]
MSSRRGSESGGTGGGKGSGGERKARARGAARGAEASKRKDAEQQGASGRKPKQNGSSRKPKAPKKQARGGAGEGRGATARTSGGRRTAAGRDRGGTARAREISAGGVVLRGNDVVVIVPTRRAADGSKVLSLPKGHVDPGETPVQAAEREVREEAGVVAEPVAELGESRYWYRRDGETIGKRVHFYLFNYVSGDTADHDDEVEEARWLPISQAEKQLTYPAEREMVSRAIEHLKEGGRKDR